MGKNFYNSASLCHACIRCSPVSVWATTCVCSTSCGGLKEWSTSSQTSGRVKCVMPNCWRACRVSALFILLDVLELALTVCEIYLSQQTDKMSVVYLPELSGVLHQCHVLASEMVHFIHQMQYYITFEVRSSLCLSSACFSFKELICIVNCIVRVSL